MGVLKNTLSARCFGEVLGTYILIFFGCGAVHAAVLTGFMTKLLHEVTPLDPWTFCVVPATLVSVAIAASLVPAWRATRIDPVRALRAE